MKKLLVALVACISLAGSAFAIDLSADFNFGVPMAFNTKHINIDADENNYTHTTVKTKETSYGADLGLMAMFTKEIGVKVDFGMYFPDSFTTTTQTTTAFLGKVSTSDPETTKTTYKKENTSMTNVSIFFGPTYKAYSKSNFSLFVTPGMNIESRSVSVTTGSGDSKTTKKSTLTYYGAGAEIQARYNLAGKVMLNLECPVVYNFKVKDSNDNQNDTKGLVIYPMIGVSYKF